MRGRRPPWRPPAVRRLGDEAAHANGRQHGAPRPGVELSLAAAAGLFALISSTAGRAHRRRSRARTSLTWLRATTSALAATTRTAFAQPPIPTPASPIETAPPVTLPGRHPSFRRRSRPSATPTVSTAIVTPTLPSGCRMGTSYLSM
jgi:hypothetical protein